MSGNNIESQVIEVGGPVWKFNDAIQKFLEETGPEDIISTPYYVVENGERNPHKNDTHSVTIFYRLPSD